jgi:carboxyl-terminal processing protease
MGAADVAQAHDLLLEKYVVPLESTALLAAAWQGATERADRAGVDVKVAAPRLEEDLSPAQNSAIFGEAFEVLAVAAPAKVSHDSLARAAITEMAASLNDGHTRFVAPESWESSSRLAPQFQYRTIRTESGTMIWDVSEGSNAEAGGLRPGDIILKINGISPQERERPAVIPPGEYALVEIERPGHGKLKLDVLPEPEGARPFEARLIGNVAYVLLHSFIPPPQKLDGDIAFEAAFSTAVLNLSAAQPDGWVLDLRDCPGGSIAALSFVSGLFGAEGRVYEATQRSGLQRSISASGPNAVVGRPLVVLVDGATASAAEVVTATLQDMGLAHVIGTVTAKKVDGALRFPLTNGGGLVITFERARAGPLRRVLDGAGVTPDELIALNTGDIRRGIDNQLARALAYIKQEAAPVGAN